MDPLTGRAILEMQTCIREDEAHMLRLAKFTRSRSTGKFVCGDVHLAYDEALALAESQALAAVGEDPNSGWRAT